MLADYAASCGRVGRWVGGWVGGWVGKHVGVLNVFRLDNRIPMYHPWAITILKKKTRRRTTVPAQRYAVKGVEASR